MWRPNTKNASPFPLLISRLEVWEEELRGDGDVFVEYRDAPCGFVKAVYSKEAVEAGKVRPPAPTWILSHVTPQKCHPPDPQTAGISTFYFPFTIVQLPYLI